MQYNMFSIYDNAVMQQMYFSVPILQACISRIATTVSAARIRIFDNNNNEIVDGDLFNLLNYPTPSISQADLINYLVTQYYIFGLSATHITPGKLRYMQSNQLYPFTMGNTKWRDDIDAYQYDGQSVSSNDIIQQVNADIRYIGDVNYVSPIRSLATGLDTYLQGQRFISNYFSNGGKPGYIINVPGITNKEDLAAFEEKWNDKFNGAENGNKAFFTSTNPNLPGEFSINAVSSKLSEIIMPELNDMTSEDVASVCGVPSIMLAGSEAKYDSAYEQISVFYASTIYPLINKYQQSFQSHLIQSNNYTWNTSTKKSKAVLNKNMEARLERAVSDNKNANLFIVFDTDTLPFAADLTSKKVDLTQALIDIGVKPYEASVYSNLDLAITDFASPKPEVKQPVKEISGVEPIVTPITYSTEDKQFLAKLKKQHFKLRIHMLTNGKDLTLKELTTHITALDIKDLNITTYAKYVFRAYHKSHNFKSAMNLNNKQLYSYRNAP